MVDWVYRNGSRLTPWMNYCCDLLDRDLRRLFGVDLVVTSGIRLDWEQEAIFRKRYTLTPNGRRVYDTRWWNGRLWYRIDPAGRVAVPKTSNHEIQGDDGAMDLADTGGPGIGTWGSERANWLRANAWRYGLEPEGYNFKEAWHYKVPGIYRTPPPSAGNTTRPEEDSMSVAIHLNNTHFFHLWPGGIKHLANNTAGGKLALGPATLTMRMVQADDRWVAMNSEEFLEQLDDFHVPRSVVRLSDGFVLDVSMDNPDPKGPGGLFVRGGAWDWARAAYANSLTDTPRRRY
ncbi:endolysin [Microbacterium phage Milani]|nr:endolysin [Microbacterium phage Milani]